MLWLRVVVIVSLIALNTLLHVPPLVLLALVKAIVPSDRLRRAFNPVLTGLAESWIAVNTAMIDAFTRTRFQIELPAGLARDGHYLVLANHQSWVDIVVLQKAFNRKIPLLRFFLKRSLFWVPVLGLAWWALDFPFMGRYSRQQIARNPELGRKDMQTTRKACEKFADIPVSVMNFVEGTRMTAAKHASQQSPYQHLLKPKSGGVAFVLDAMGSGLQSIVDVTLVYPGGRPSMIDLIGNRVPEVRVVVRQRPIPAELVNGDYQGDREFRVRFQRWMNQLWEEKDSQISQLLK
ncbi:MAG: acyltransferase [Stenotrophomonas sp.]